MMVDSQQQRNSAYRQYGFDKVFGQHSSQREVYDVL
jgi:hypothetical protein